MKTETIEEIEIVKEVPRFKGYTLDEIRYQRAMLGVRKEFCKAKVMAVSYTHLRAHET